MDNRKKRGTQDRSKINMSEDYEVKYWTKELGVDREKLQKAVDKVGNSAAAVRKELGLLGAPHYAWVRIVPFVLASGGFAKSRQARVGRKTRMQVWRGHALQMQ